MKKNNIFNKINAKEASSTRKHTQIKLRTKREKVNFYKRCFVSLLITLDQKKKAHEQNKK